MANIFEKVLRPTARGRIWQVFFIIVVLALVSGLIDAGNYYNKGVDYLSWKTHNSVVLPKAKEIPFRLGLDLQGGSRLVYEADMKAIPEADRADALQGVRDVIERRVNVFGVSEPLIQTSISGNVYRIMAELAGIKDIKEAIKMIGETPLLEFKEEAADKRSLTAEEKASMEKFNADAEKKAEDALGKLLSNGDFAAIAKEYSDDQKTKEAGGDMGWITEKDAPEVVAKVKDFQNGQMTNDLVKESNGFDILKLEEKRAKTDAFNNNEPVKEVKASHLLICYQGIENCSSNYTKEQAYAKIKEIAAKATPKNFADLVKQNTTEPGGAARAGDLGWFGKGDMVEPFETAVFPQAVGTISYVVETKFGYHLIYKEAERNVTEYKVSRIFVQTITEADILNQLKNWKNTELTGKNLKRATVQFDPNDNTPQVGLEFDAEGADMFAAITERNIGKGLGIFLDGGSIVDVNGDGEITAEEVYAPTVNDKITGGKAVISGNMTIQSAKQLAQRLNAGALPVPITLVNQQTVGSTLGQESLDASLLAGFIGLLLVALFMILFYRLPGLMSVFALVLYGAISLAIFKLWPVTLTLSGMAGFIMSIGMAVDANVLIFSRLREELASGKRLGLALEEAFRRAWPSIRDSNISTLITCFILIEFSTSIVKGFAVTLSLGVLVSMFSAIFITRNFLRLIPENWLEKKHWLIGGTTGDHKMN